MQWNILIRISWTVSIVPTAFESESNRLRNGIGSIIMSLSRIICGSKRIRFTTLLPHAKDGSWLMPAVRWNQETVITRLQQPTITKSSVKTEGNLFRLISFLET
jgi:hypothetical protein